MCLANRYYEGIHVPQNYDLASYYYSFLAGHANKFIEEQPIGPVNLDSYSIRINSFNKGLYGEGASESYSALTRTSESNEIDKNFFNELNVDPDAHYYVELYYAYRKYYEGDYLTPRNYTKAFEVALLCANAGIKMPSIQRYINNPNKQPTLETLFIGRCVSGVGHMYLRGEGVEQNYTEALDWLNIASNLVSSSAVLNDLGNIYEYALGLPEPDYGNARTHYVLAHRKGGSRAAFNLGKLMLQRGEASESEKAWELIKSAAYSSYPQAMYFYGQAIEQGERSGYLGDLATLYKYFVEKIEPVFADLDWAFKCLVAGDIRSALLGYAMAAEQGYESAQSSAAFILYPTTSYLEEHPKVPIDRYKSALNYYQRSAKQRNMDSAVFVGDMYFYGLQNDTNSETDVGSGKQYLMAPDLEKAASMNQKLPVFRVLKVDLT
ncbi:unnamed protein product [Ambrosiozyma monospora]|uniref:Unnamed protein product n=1 Tax=Ambrosiozyma monospora TaxID=43982 RepID=A0ACB5TBE7_AMBMO|nr:unnamed protein product [Ambrosiozyma monospora]